MRYDWLLTGVLVLAALWSFWRLARELSDFFAEHWIRFLSRPIWFRWAAWLLLIWIGLRVLRTSPRVFLWALFLIAGVLLWAEAAARSRRS